VSVRNAHDIEGQRVKVESHGKDVVIEEVVVCDDAGTLVAAKPRDCRWPETRYDIRRDKVRAFSNEAKSSVGLVVVGILAALLIPPAIVGSAILTAGH
jgi:hypothetical protein